MWMGLLDGMGSVQMRDTIPTPGLSGHAQRAWRSSSREPALASAPLHPLEGE